MKMKTKKVVWRRYYWTIPAAVLLVTLARSGLIESHDRTMPAVTRAMAIEDPRHPPEEQQVVESIYPIEKVGVIARSVTFPQVLSHGQAIINTEYPNASILCMDVANYSGLVTGLIWSMDRATVEEYRLQYLIDWASTTFLTCISIFIPSRVVNPDRVIAASAEMEEKTPAVSMEDAKKAVVAQIEKIQAVLSFAQSVKSKQKE
jgi:hypothetical protein